MKLQSKKLAGKVAVITGASVNMKTFTLIPVVLILSIEPGAMATIRFHGNTV